MEWGVSSVSERRSHEQQRGFLGFFQAAAVRDSGPYFSSIVCESQFHSPSMWWLSASRPVVEIWYSQIKITRSTKVNLDLSLLLESLGEVHRPAVSMWDPLPWHFTADAALIVITACARCQKVTRSLTFAETFVWNLLFDQMHPVCTFPIWCSSSDWTTADSSHLREQKHIVVCCADKWQFHAVFLHLKDKLSRVFPLWKGKHIFCGIWGIIVMVVSNREAP